MFTALSLMEIGQIVWALLSQGKKYYSSVFKEQFKQQNM
jgi:hypothetical protein